MSVNSGAHSAKGGFNQSGGAHFIVISDISGKLNVLTPSTGSGGGVTAPVMTVTAAATIAPGLASAGSWVGAGKLIKDMGKTVIAGGVTYRKFQTVQTPSATNAGGQMGASPTYYSFYLEVGRDGQQAVSPAGIARYF
jgi:hypothetical protein